SLRHDHPHTSEPCRIRRYVERDRSLTNPTLRASHRDHLSHTHSLRFRGVAGLWGCGSPSTVYVAACGSCCWLGLLGLLLEWHGRGPAIVFPQVIRVALL